MSKTKYRIDALFAAIGLYYAFTGKVSIFVAFLLASVLHELAHQTAAGMLGYSRGRVKLTPYGAVLSDSCGVMSMASDIKISLSGVAANLIVMGALLAVWWLYPSAYGLTSAFFNANAVIAAFNVLPAYPLDGARVILALTGHDRRAFYALKGTACVLGASMCVLGIISAGYRLNPSLLLTGAFLIFGALADNERDRYYSVLKSMPCLKDYTAPVEKRAYAVSGGMRLKGLVKKIRRDAICEFELYIDGRKYTITENLLAEIVKNNDLNATLNEILLKSLLK